MTKRILVVEDTEDNRRILRDLLTRAGFELIEAMDGESGVSMAIMHRPDRGGSRPIRRRAIFRLLR